MINFSSVLNLFSKILFWGKIWDVHASKAECLQPYSFFIINDQYSRQVWVILALIEDHCKIHRLNQSSSVALGVPLNFKYFLINIKLPKCLKCGQCILLWQYWIKIRTELRSMTWKVWEERSRDLGVKSLRTKPSSEAYKLHTVRDYRLQMEKRYLRSSNMISSDSL
jgi:hypothetical protein